MIRDDLIALDPDALAALTNRGLVKRALRDLDAGRGPALDVELDGTVVARSKSATGDEVVARLPPGAVLTETECTCAAPGMCRHRVAAVLAYRAAHERAATSDARSRTGERDGEREARTTSSAPAPATPESLSRTRERAGVREAPTRRIPEHAEHAGATADGWSPGAIDDDALRAHLGRAAFRRAERHAGVLAHTVRGPGAPAAKLPTCTVRFLVPHDLRYARCDCAAQGPCAHVALAVWAFRRADESASDAVTVGEAPPVRLAALEPARALTRELLLDGAANAGATIAARLARARRPLSRARLRWPAAICDDLEATLADHAARDARYHPERVGDLLTELHARALAAEDGALPAAAVLGRDEPAETRIERLRLVSLGARLRLEARDGDQGTRAHASVFFADPGARTVLVLRKRWDVPPGETGPALARRHVQRGVSLGALARGQVVTGAAKRRADRTLVLGRGAAGRTGVTPQRGDWDRLGAPIFADDLAALSRTLRAQPPAVVAPRVRAARVHAVAVHAIGRWGWRAGPQTLVARIHDRAGRSLRLDLPSSAAAPHAVDALARALEGAFGPVRFVSGEVRRVGESLVMTPLAVAADRVVALALEPVDGAGALPHEPDDEPTDPIHDALLAARTHLDAGAHRGLCHAPARWHAELARIAGALDDVGLHEHARRTRAAADATDDETRVDAWLAASLRVRLALGVG